MSKPSNITFDRSAALFFPEEFQLYLWYASADDSCLYHSVSIILQGDELALRAATVSELMQCLPMMMQKKNI